MGRTVHVPHILLATLVVKIFAGNTYPTVQVDLVFPRNNAVYQPVWPFPIVFAIHNISSAWSYKPVLHWRLDENDARSGGTFDTGSAGWIGWDPRTAQPGQGPPGDRLLAINSSRSVANVNQTTYTMEYYFRMGHDDCLADYPYWGSGTSQTPPVAWFGDIITFKVNNTSGAMPDILSNGPCAEPLGTIAIVGQNKTDDRCPLIRDSQPKPIPCAFPLDTQVADQVSKAMAYSSGCKKIIWPNGTGYWKACEPEKKSEGHVFGWHPFAVLLSTLAFLLALG